MWNGSRAYRPTDRLNEDRLIARERASGEEGESGSSSRIKLNVRGSAAAQGGGVERFGPLESEMTRRGKGGRIFLDAYGSTEGAGFENRKGF